MSMGLFVSVSVSVNSSVLDITVFRTSRLWATAVSVTESLLAFSNIESVENISAIAHLSMTFDCLMMVGLSVPINLSFIMFVADNYVVSGVWFVANIHGAGRPMENIRPIHGSVFTDV